MSGVIAAISFGMLGLFLPLVIFLQSVLSLSALQAGLILAPMSLASVASAPFAGRSTDRHGGRSWSRAIPKQGFGQLPAPSLPQCGPATSRRTGR